MKKPPYKEYGRSSIIELSWRLEPLTSQKIAAIVTYSGSIEYYLERAIWRCEGIDPNGIRPETDAKPISNLIPSFKKFSENLEDNKNKSFIQLWCAACASGFIIRNNIVHGVAGVIGDTLTYSRNSCWHGERRKREFGDFWADASTLDMVCESFAVLLRIIVKIERGEESLHEISTPLALRALQEARSILGEFSNQSYNPSFEKY
ncbi:hypothetical protein KUL113_51100 [Tenacibaculum sp. KUL113]|nr:hypothetical protein KUL113_51100 [Tenacibaculum sp. KUL113]